MSARREYPGRRFKEYFQALLDGGREVSDDQGRELRARWEAWSEAYQRQPTTRFSGGGGLLHGAQRPPDWEIVTTKLGLEPLAKPTTSAGSRRRGAPRKPWNEKLRKLLIERLDYGTWTQEEIAEQVYMSSSTVQRWEQRLKAERERAKGATAAPNKLPRN